MDIALGRVLKELGMKQAVVARGTGLNPQTICKAVAGGKVNRSTKRMIAQFVGRDESELFALESLYDSDSTHSVKEAP